SFVKSYASEVNLDPQVTTRRYLDQFVPPAPPPDAEPATQPAPAEAPRDTPAWAPARVLRGRFGTPAVVFLVTVTALALVVKNYRQANAIATPQRPPAGTTSVVPAGPPQPSAVGTSGKTAAPQNLHIGIAPTGPCW